MKIISFLCLVTICSARNILLCEECPKLECKNCTTCTIIRNTCYKCGEVFCNDTKSCDKLDIRETYVNDKCYTPTPDPSPPPIEELHRMLSNERIHSTIPSIINNIDYYDSDYDHFESPSIIEYHQNDSNINMFSIIIVILFVFFFAVGIMCTYIREKERLDKVRMCRMV